MSGISYKVTIRLQNSARTLAVRLSAACLSALLVFTASPALAKYASLVIDSETGRVIHEINADTRNYPASLTKMMTLYLVFGALESELWTLNTQLRVSARAARQPASKLDLRRGQTISVKNAILALVTKSANDVATVIAENLSGSERGFALKMTVMARKLGMHRTTFRNASGLPHRGQLSTARDMGVLARALIKNYPKYYRYFSTDRFDYRGDSFSNHNKLLKTYDGVDGIKTGYIRASGFNLVASANRNGQRVIGVIFGGNSPRSRNALMTRLLNLGFKAINKDPRPVYVSGDKAFKTSQYRSRLKAAAKTKATPPARTEARRSQLLPKNRRWAIQVGAFARSAQAFEAARRAIEIAPSLLTQGAIKVLLLKKRNGKILHRARIRGITKKQAYRACRFIEKRKGQCMEIRLRDGFEVAFNDR
ncbi:MAG: D-alanyl-D-alanine carboxypeptidase [Alphaproteobacteria bacterium]|nr:D-alanyl-D-alanine carboxypeptidase [Alphaproteobacteria bacterium]